MLTRRDEVKLSLDAGEPVPNLGLLYPAAREEVAIGVLRHREGIGLRQSSSGRRGLVRLGCLNALRGREEKLESFSGATRGEPLVPVLAVVRLDGSDREAEGHEAERESLDPYAAGLVGIEGDDDLLHPLAYEKRLVLGREAACAVAGDHVMDAEDFEGKGIEDGLGKNDTISIGLRGLTVHEALVRPLEVEMGGSSTINSAAVKADDVSIGIVEGNDNAAAEVLVTIGREKPEGDKGLVVGIAEEIGETSIGVADVVATKDLRAHKVSAFEVGPGGL